MLPGLILEQAVNRRDCSGVRGEISLAANPLVITFPIWRKYLAQDNLLGSTTPEPASAYPRMSVSHWQRLSHPDFASILLLFIYWTKLVGLRPVLWWTGAVGRGAVLGLVVSLSDRPADDYLRWHQPVKQRVILSIFCYRSSKWSATRMFLITDTYTDPMWIREA